jgi:hypothetical protein
MPYTQIAIFVLHTKSIYNMNNFDIYNIVNYVVNIDINGNAYSPEEFERDLNGQSLRLFKKKLGLPEEYQPNAPIPRQGVDVSSVNQRDLRPFLVKESLTAASGVYDISAKKVAHVLGLSPSPQTGFPCDELTSSEYYDRVNNPITQPTLYYPAYAWTSDAVIEFLPSTITNFNIRYYKFPTDAVVVIDANATTLLPEYNADSSTELEWDDINKMDLVYMILRNAGVNLQRQDVQAYADNVVKSGN